MKRELTPMTLVVKNFNINKQTIEDFDVFKYREVQIKKLKKKCSTKEEFAEALKREMQYHYWSRAEYELIVKITEDNRVILEPWVGCKNPQEVAIDVTDDESFDWREFAEKHINKQIYKNEAKIDVFDQICYGGRFEKLVENLWVNRLKYERDSAKFHQ